MEFTETIETVTEENEIVFESEDIAPEAPEEGVEADAAGQQNGEHSLETAEPEEWMLEVKYNGERQTLTKQQAVELAQKGLNYDKVMDRLKAAESAEELVRLNKLASDAGMKPAEYLSSIVDRLRQADDEKLKQSYMQKGVSDRLADELVREERQRKEDRAAMNELKRELEFFKARERAKEAWTSFTREHPDIQSYDELPLEVKEAVRKGRELSDAYNEYELDRLKKQLAQEAQAQSNLEKAPSSVRSTGPAEDRDDFLKGFFGSF